MRRRNMYYMTGLPGWMRFGYSPGWAGGGRSMGPCAQYLMTDQWPTPQTQQAWSAMQAGQSPQFAATGAAADAASRRLAWLQQQATMLEQQLKAVQQQIADLQQDE